ncbi:hypothetical protein, partial [Halorubrum sp. BV1]|uniref:hypothetical protein n=1 Tax=Halorubrum sp. BV1 TaxID=1498500 RepID=UPI00067908FE
KIDIEYSEAITATDQEDKQIRWIPDCQIEATDGWNGELLERYWCEIKTGDASFQRHQIETMEQFAVEHRVLKAKVRIDDLPDNYTVAFHEVSPPTDKEY